MSGPLPDGSFPTSGPLPYLFDDEGRARDARLGQRPPNRTWFHATDERTASIAVRQGLAPSCWRGSDCCAVCGHADRDDVHAHQGAWVIEIHSPALEGELKAWWVPPRYVRGAWVGNEFVPADRLRSATPDPGRDTAAPCHCELATLVEQEIGAWRQTHLPI